MTAQILQEELVKEIGVIFRDDLFKDSAGEYIKMNVYEQNLPIRQDEDAPDPMPHMIVRLETGQDNGGVEPQEVFVILRIGYFDDDAGNNGHKGVLGIIQKIQSFCGLHIFNFIFFGISLNLAVKQRFRRIMVNITPFHYVLHH